MLPILLDTDPGVDDALAIFLAACSPELELVAVTTVAGNVGLEQTTRNALMLLELAGRLDVVVHAGETPAASPRAIRRSGAEDTHRTVKTVQSDLYPPKAEPPTAADVHGADGLGGITHLTNDLGHRLYPPPSRLPDRLPAAAAIPRYARDRPGEIVLIAIGPLTNLAQAARRDPEGLQRLREVVIMGGAFRCPGNVTAVAEFNVYVDPEAAQVVLELGVPVRFVPLDVTEQVMIHPVDLERSGSGGGLFRDLLQHTFDFYEERVGYRACHLHDPLAVAAVIWPDLLRFRAASVAVETSGAITRGMTVADLRQRRVSPQPNSAFAEAVDAARARRLILDRLLSS